MARREENVPQHGTRWLALALLACVLASAGCATDYEAPIEQKSALSSATRSASSSTPRATNTAVVERDQPTPAGHVVASGDTLLTIAWRYGLDVRDLIRWNQITNPDLIVIGESLRLRSPTPPPSSSSPRTPTVMTPMPVATAVPDNVVRTTPPIGKPATRISMAPLAPAASPAVSALTPTPSPSAPPARVAPTSTDSATDNDKPAAADSASNLAANKAGLRWMWPTQGKVSAADAESVTKGIDIRGARGQAVKAAAGGTVVYSGSGLRGYGELIIVQHNDTFLSAYAHNEARLVQEGRHVDAGEPIARMGNSDTTDVMLHFEIRRNGKAVDPLQYLPNR